MPSLDELLQSAGAVFTDFCCYDYTGCKDFLEREMKQKKTQSPRRDAFLNFLTAFLNAEKALTSMAFRSTRSMFSKLIKSNKSSIATYKLALIELQKFEDTARQNPSSKSFRSSTVLAANKSVNDNEETDDMNSFVIALKLIVNARATLMETIESLFSNAAVHLFSAALFEEKCTQLCTSEADLRTVFDFSRKEVNPVATTHEGANAALESTRDFAPLYAFVNFASLELRIVASMLKCECALMRHDYFDTLAMNHQACEAMRRLFISTNLARANTPGGSNSTLPSQPLQSFYVEWRQLLYQKTALLFRSILDKCESPISASESDLSTSQQTSGSLSSSRSEGSGGDLFNRIHSFYRTFSQRNTDVTLSVRVILCLGSHAPDGVTQEHLNALLSGYRFPVDSILQIAAKKHAQGEPRTRNESETRVKSDLDTPRVEGEDVEWASAVESSDESWPVTGINLYPVVFACPTELSTNANAIVKQQRIWPTVVMQLTELFPSDSLASGSTMRSYSCEKDTVTPFANSLTMSVASATAATQPPSTATGNRTSSVSSASANSPQSANTATPPQTADWSTLYSKVLYSKLNDCSVYLHRVDTHYAVLVVVEPSQGQNAQAIARNDQIDKFITELGGRMRTAQLFNDFKNNR